MYKATINEFTQEVIVSDTKGVLLRKTLPVTLSHPDQKSLMREPENLKVCYTIERFVELANLGKATEVFIKQNS